MKKIVFTLFVFFTSTIVFSQNKSYEVVFTEDLGAYYDLYLASSTFKHGGANLNKLAEKLISSYGNKVGNSGTLRAYLYDNKVFIPINPQARTRESAEIVKNKHYFARLELIPAFPKGAENRITIKYIEH